MQNKIDDDDEKTKPKKMSVKINASNNNDNNKHQQTKLQQRNAALEGMTTITKNSTNNKNKNEICPNNYYCFEQKQNQNRAEQSSIGSRFSLVC